MPFYRYIPRPEHCSFFQTAFILILSRVYPKRSKDRILCAPFIFPAGQGPYWFSVGNARARYSHTAALCAYNAVLLQTPFAIVSREPTCFARSFSTCSIPRWEKSRWYRESSNFSVNGNITAQVQKTYLIFFSININCLIIFYAIISIFI